MSTGTQVDERAVHTAVNEIVERVVEFDDDTRRRIFRAVGVLLFDSDIASNIRSTGAWVGQNPPSQSVRPTSFTESAELSPKDFLFRKQPRTDVERAACLAFYLTHYRDAPHFKTADISLLNTEAAQVKLSNAAYTVANATNAGLLVSAGKGAKQLSALGERFVEALPDRAAAKEIRASIRSRRNRNTSKNRKRSRD